MKTMKTKTNVMMTMAVMTAFTLFSCQEGTETTTTGETAGDTAVETQTAEAQENNLQEVYDDYLEIKEALVESDAEEARKAAEEFSRSIDGANVENAESLKQPASEIASSTDIEAQRKAFSSLSEQFIQVIKNNPGSVDEAYVAHCPMAFNNEGANWISDEKEIRNPYFGDKMLKCGSVKETL